jgi:hypothetical protein
LHDESRDGTEHNDGTHPLVRVLETQRDMPGDSLQSRAVLGALIANAPA